ncbi:MAG TPA: AbrB/MazE/SpoVT family DNA-binding domain-containing protein [Candidatus Acidoferrales bacterium]|nr:AbrB/MazE/SpoVT family DNA-binding domain-containing protein [Candidatus Acidoferrales bacterium]
MTKGVKPVRRRGYTRLSSKRQVTLPIRVVEELNLNPGDELSVRTEAGRVVLSREEGIAARRRRALAEFAGSMPGVWEPGELHRLRDEWR